MADNLNAPIAPQANMPPPLGGALTPTDKDARKSALLSRGFSEAQIEAILSLADPDDQGNSLTPTHFYSLNKQTLNQLQYTGKMDEESKKLIYKQAPLAMLQEVSKPSNWQGNNYIGPAASQLNSYILGEPVDFKKPSLDALVMSVLTKRAEIIEVQLQDQINDIKAKNAQVAEANEILNEMKSLKDEVRESGTRKFSEKMQNYFDKVGMDKSTYKTGDLDAKNWDVNISALRAKIDDMTSNSQLATTKLQQTINKYNQSFEMLSNFINKYYQSIGTIIQNLR